MEEFYGDLIPDRERETPKHLNGHNQIGVREVRLTINAMPQEIEIGNGKVIVKGIIEDFGTDISYQKEQTREGKKC